jgi:glycosyltransferase A (GT-A) superfamily protein (DUF2064 family)
MLKDIAKQASLVSDSQLIIFHPPNSNIKDFKNSLPLTTNFIAQKGDNLGERMSNCFDLLLNENSCEKVIIVGSDCITNTAEIFKDIFSLLSKSDIVIRPADDGGYVMIAQSKYTPEIFHNIKWGTNSVFCETRKILDKSTILYYEMEESFDIDSIDDLQKLKDFFKNNPNTHIEKFINNSVDM